MNRATNTTWALLCAAGADVSWLNAPSNINNRRALRMNSIRTLTALPESFKGDESQRIINWLSLPREKLRQTIVYGTLLLFRQALAPKMVAGDTRRQLADLVGQKTIIDVLSMPGLVSNGLGDLIQPDWRDPGSFFHPGLALMYRLMLNHSTYYAKRLVTRFNKEEVQGMQGYVIHIEAATYAHLEHLIFDHGEQHHDHDYEAGGLAHSYGSRHFQ